MFPAYNKSAELSKADRERWEKIKHNDDLRRNFQNSSVDLLIEFATAYATARAGKAYGGTGNFSKALEASSRSFASRQFRESDTTQESKGWLNEKTKFLLGSDLGNVAEFINPDPNCYSCASEAYAKIKSDIVFAQKMQNEEAASEASSNANWAAAYAASSLPSELRHNPDLSKFKIDGMSDDLDTKTKIEILRRNLQRTGLLSSAESVNVAAQLKEAELTQLNFMLQKTFARMDSIDTRLQAQELRQQWESIASGADGIARFGASIKCKELEVIGGIAANTAKISGAIAAVNKLKESEEKISALAAGGPIFAAINLLCFISSLFSEPGPNPMQQIMDQLQEISKQVAALHKAMSAGFSALEKQNLRNLETLLRGFEHLSICLRDNISGFRIKTEAAHARIIASLDFALGFLRESASNQYLRDLHKLMSDAQSDHLSSEQIKDRSIGLEEWVLTAAANPALNGGLLISAEAAAPLPDANTLKLLQACINDEDILPSLIAWLMNYYEPHSALIMSNALVLHQAAQQYIALQKKNPSLDSDPYDARLDKMRNLLFTNISLIEKMGNDQVFFDRLHTEYKQAVSEVNTAFRACAAEKSNKLIESRNAARVSKVNTNSSRQADLQSGNLYILAEPKFFAKAFLTRTIDSLPEIDQIRNRERIFAALKSRVPLPDILVAEYLGLLSITRVAIGNLDIEYKPPAPKNVFMGLHIKPMKARDEHNGNWTLSLDFFSGSDQILSINFSGDRKADERFSFHQMGHDKDTYKKQLQEDIIKWLNDPQQTFIKSSVVLMTSAATKERINNSIKDFFKGQRKELVSQLYCSMPDSAKSKEFQQALTHAGIKADIDKAQKLQEALTNLDLRVARLKVFAHLAGKNIRQHYFAKLIGSDQVAQGIEEYIKNKTADSLNSLLFAQLKSAIPSIAIKTAQKTRLSATHPLGLYSETLRCLIAHGMHKAALRMQNSQLIAKQDGKIEQHLTARLNQYYFESIISAQKQILEGVYGFTKAIHMIKRSSIAEINSAEFATIRQACWSWALEASIHSEQTGDNVLNPIFKNSPLSIARLCSQTEVAARTINEALALPWQQNIQLLATLLHEYDLPKHFVRNYSATEDNERLCNPELLIDGALAFIRLLNLPNCTSYSDATNDTEILNCMLRYALNFKKFVTFVGTSRTIFNNIINDYLTQLDYLDSDAKNGILTYYKKQNPSHTDEQLVDSNIDAIIRYLTALNTLRLLCHAYMQIAFAAEPELAADTEAPGLNVLLSPEQFISLLKDGSGADMLSKLAKHRSEVQDLQHKIAKVIARRNDELSFEFRLADGYSRSFGDAALNIDAGYFELNIITARHIQILDNFLQRNPAISTIAITGGTFSPEAYDLFIACIRTKASILKLKVANVEFKAAQLLAMIDLLPQLLELDLRGNNLDYALMRDFMSKLNVSSQQRYRKLIFRFAGNHIAAADKDKLLHDFARNAKVLFDPDLSVDLEQALSSILTSNAATEPTSHLPQLLSYPAIDAIIMDLALMRAKIAPSVAPGYSPASERMLP